MKTNVALIGYMGTGKTAVGRILAENRKMPLLETDQIIEKQAGIPIPEIFRREGETGFREREIAAVREIASVKNTVIACGGGIVLNRINIDRLKENSVIVCLTASPKTIVKRVSGQAGQRPLLEVDDMLTTIIEMLRFRRPLYERAADIIVNTNRLLPGTIAEKIIIELGKYEDFDFKK
jgi:shikimate kinase